MKLHPVGSGSVLVSRYFHLMYTPRILRFGVAQSLLAARLRRRVGFSFDSDRRLSSRPANGVAGRPSPIKAPSIESAERFWPSDRIDEEVRIVVELTLPERIELPVGAILDLWM